MLNHGRCGSVLLYYLHLGNQTGFWLPSSWVKTIPGQAFSPLSLTNPVCHTSVHIDPSGSHDGGIKEHVAPGKWDLVVQRWPCFDPCWLSRLCHPTQLSPHAAVTHVFSLTLQGVESSSNTELNYTLLCFALFYGCFEDIRRLKVPRLQNRAVIMALFWEEIVRLIAWLWNVIAPYT